MSEQTNTNIHLIDASRSSAIEGLINADNINNKWTNNISEGLKLNSGDKVSVAYSSINEIGCGDSALETTGKKLKKSVKYTNTSITTNRNPKSDVGKNIEFGPYGVESVSATNDIVELDVSDNEFNVGICYYKTTNGENYIHLPRAFDNGIDPLGEDIDYNETGTVSGMGPEGWKTRDDERKKLWYQPDDVLNGRPSPPKYRSLNDWHWYMGCRAYMPKTLPPAFGVLAYDETLEPTRGTQYFDYNGWKQKNDNSRYTLFVADYTPYSTQDTTLYETECFNREYIATATTSKFDFNFTLRDPSLMKFHQYTELKQYEVDVGFNDPHNVAFKLSSQLSDPKGGVETIKSYQVGYKASEVASIQPVPDYDAAITQNQEGEVFKPFAAGNWKTFRRGNPANQTGGSAPAPEPADAAETNLAGAFANYFTPYLWTAQTVIAGDTADEKAAQILQKQQDILDYQSTYNMIGVKRPELWIAGRELLFNESIIYPQVLKDTSLPAEGDNIWVEQNEPIQHDIQNTEHYYCAVSTEDGRTTDYLKTWFPYTKETLLALRKYFKAQKLYKELIDFPRRDTATVHTNNTDIIKMDTPPVQPTLMTNEGTETTGIDDPMDKRFLHINQVSIATYGKNPEGGLGFDSAGYPAAAYLTDYTGQASKADESIPFFFAFQSENEDTYIDTSALPIGKGTEYTYDGKTYHRPDQLCYGFAKKWTHTYPDSSTRDLIALSVQGLPAESFPDAAVVSLRSMGHDWHFNAYGTSAIALYSGWMPNDPKNNGYCGLAYQGKEKAGAGANTGWTGGGGPTLGGSATATGHQPGYRTSVLTPAEGYGISALLRQVYVGAIDPSIIFNSQNSRFQISGLHTPEWIMNAVDAGKPDATNTATGIVDPLTDAGTEVYKINKKIVEWNNYTPEMLPYRLKESFKAPLHQRGDHFWHNDGGTPDKWSYQEIVEVSGKLEPNTGGGSTAAGGYVLAGQPLNKANQAAGGCTGVYCSSAESAGYFGEHGDKLQNGDAWGVRKITEEATYLEVNPNLENFVVYDSNCGIYFEDFGIDNEEDWYDSLFGIMGWSWQQMNPDKISGSTQLNRQTRLTRVNYDSMKPLTTSADIPLKDVPTNVKNLWSQTMYSCQIPCPLISNLWYGFTFSAQANEVLIYDSSKSSNNEIADAAKEWGDGSVEAFYAKLSFLNGDLSQLQIYPQTVNPQTSQSITADGLPIKMKNPYFLVKSNIIADSFYLKDKTPLPIVAVVNKENGFGDFYFSQESQMIFTITNPTTLSEIHTEIYNADMTPARCDRHSGIIYKIEKLVQSNPDLIQQLITINKDIGEVQKKNVEGNIPNISPISKKDFI